MRNYIQEHKITPDGFTVERYSIITTSAVVYTVMEPAASDWSSHSTVGTLDGKKMGYVYARRLPAELDRLPIRTQERSEAVSAWHRGLYELCTSAILQAYPHLHDTPHEIRWNGEIITYEGPGEEPEQ